MKWMEGSFKYVGCKKIWEIERTDTNYRKNKCVAKYGPVWCTFELKIWAVNSSGKYVYAWGVLNCPPLFRKFIVYLQKGALLCAYIVLYMFKYPEIQHLFSACPQYGYTVQILRISQRCIQGCHSSGERLCDRVIKSFCFKDSLYLQNVRVSVLYDIVIFHKYGILWSPCIAHYFDYTF